MFSFPPITKLRPFFGGQFGVPGSEPPLGIRMEPQTLVWYVDAGHPDADDNNDGTDPVAPLATIQQAIDNNNATIAWAETPPYDAQNWIIIAPGRYAENLTVPFYCKMVGLGNVNGNDVAVSVEPAAGSAMAGTGLGTTLINIRFAVETAVPIMDFGVMNSCLFVGCVFADGNAGLATVGVDTTDAGGSRIIGCSFAYNTSPMPIGIRSTGAFFDCYVKDCEIRAATTGIDLSGAGLCGGAVAHANRIWNGGSGAVLATGIDDSVVGDLLCTSNWITATDAINHADAAMTIDNHVQNAGVGAIETAGT